MPRCMWRRVRRRFSRGPRQGVRPNCPDTMDFEFLRYAWRYNRDKKPGILAAYNRCAKPPHYIVLKNQKAINRLLQSVGAVTE